MGKKIPKTLKNNHLGYTNCWPFKTGCVETYYHDDFIIRKKNVTVP